MPDTNNTGIKAADEPKDAAGSPSTASTAAVLGTTTLSGAATLSGTPGSKNATASGTNVPQASQGLSDGAVAGVAIGCFFAGVLISLIAAFLLWRYKKKKSSRHHAARGSTEKGAARKQPNASNSTSAASSDNALEHVILQATPDNDIVGKLKRLEVIIEQHVENCYHLLQIDANVSVLAQTLAGLGISQNTSGFEPEVVASWCLQPRSRPVALQHVISHVLFSSIDCRSGSTPTMLPESVAAFLRTIRPIEQYRENFDVMSFALTRWRTLSALLLHPNPNERTPLEPPKAAVKHQAQELAGTLDLFLRHFVAPDQASQQKQYDHLQVLIVDAAKLGYALFSHTSDWRFIYKDEGSETVQARIVVCVGLEKLSHRDGHRLPSPQRVLDPRLIVV